jgi:hypothetical protein
LSEYRAAAACRGPDGLRSGGRLDLQVRQGLCHQRGPEKHGTAGDCRGSNRGMDAVTDTCVFK